MVVETRSQRKNSQQVYQYQRPPYPQIATQSSTSPSQSVFQSSSSSVASTSSPSSLTSPMSGVLQWSPNMPHQQQQQSQTHFSAPLPSPSAGNDQQTMTGYFGAATTQHSHFGQQQRIQPSGQNGQGPGQRSNGGGTPETAGFLKDFGLLAEAAKRAQMACIERDMGECWL